MKTQQSRTISSFVPLLFFFGLFIVEIAQSNIANSDVISNYCFDNTFCCLPDSTFEDTTTSSEFSTGDTLQVVVEGNDTLYVLYEDTLSDSLSEELKLIPLNHHIKIVLGNTTKTVQSGLFGICATDFFEPGHGNVDENDKYNVTAEADNPSELLVALNPSTIRFPGGAGDKFFNPLGSIINTTLASQSSEIGLTNGGYGIDLEEAIPFYDVTNLEPYPGYTITELHDLSTADVTWIDDGSRQDFIDLKDKFFKQNYPDYPDLTSAAFDATGIDLEDQPLYINDFIRLVQQIETTNGSTVNVIYCANILTETAQDVKRTIQYLRGYNATTNPNGNTIYPLHVAGVELGNEVYFKFGQQSLGFANYGGVCAFTHYWNYINGYDYINGVSGTGDVFQPVDYPYAGATIDHTTFTSGDFDINSVLPAYMQTTGAHDYIGVLKDASDPYFSIDIGIPAHNLPNDGTHPFIYNPDEEIDNLIAGFAYTDWNDAIYNHYDSQEGAIPSFNAVIVHVYLNPSNSSDLNTYTNTNWQDILLSTAAPCIDPLWPLSSYIYSDEWTYGTADPNLSCAFNGLVGFGSLEGNFKSFITTNLKNYYTALSNQLHLDLTGSTAKKIWATESNLGYQPNENNATMSAEDIKALEIIDAPYDAMVPNTFSHLYLLWEWMLRNMKLNFAGSFANDFFTQITWQSFMGGTPIDLLSPADIQDKVELGLLPDCPSFPPPAGYPVELAADESYYVARETFYGMTLLSQIPALHLKYLPTTGLIYAGNNNIVPSMFFDFSTYTLYGYYTNIRDEEQTYIIDLGDLGSLFPPYSYAYIEPGTIPTGMMVDADQLYSTSGANAMFTPQVNSFYTDCEPALTYDNRFEITGSESLPFITPPVAPPSGGICVTVPEISAGYFAIPISVIPARLGSYDMFYVYPNPANTVINVGYINSLDIENSSLEIEIRDISGKQLIHKIISAFETVDISNLPVGVYSITILKEGHAPESEKFIKMK